MRATRELPAGYAERFHLDLSRSGGVLLLLNLAAIPLLLFFGWLFAALSRSLRPAFWAQGDVLNLSLTGILSLLAAVLLMILLHEAAHGLFFWLFTGEMPKFGFKGAYAYAAAPGWHIPRNQYLVVGLAPLVLLSLLGLALMPFTPLVLFPALLLLLTFNAAGAVGDLLVVWKVLNYSRDALVLDLGDGFVIFDRVQNS